MDHILKQKNICKTLSKYENLYYWKVPIETVRKVSETLYKKNSKFIKVIQSLFQDNRL